MLTISTALSRNSDSEISNFEGQEDFLEMPYHQMIMNDQIPLSIGGGIGQARTFMYLLRTAHLGEVTVSVWPKQLKEICDVHNIKVLD